MALKKQWYDIVAPEMFGSKVVGETPVADPKHLVGRNIDVSIVEISRNYAKFFIKLRFRAERVEGGKVFTKFIGHDIMRERIYRMVQRYGRRVDVIQDVRTKDGYAVRVKSVFMLIRRVGTSLKDAARKSAAAAIEKIAAETDFEDFIQAIIRGDIQSQVRSEAVKIYPVGNFEVRKTELLAEPTEEKTEAQKTRQRKKKAKEEKEEAVSEA